MGGIRRVGSKFRKMSTMKKLARKFKNLLANSNQTTMKRESWPTLDDTRPIDTHEQEEIVRSFESINDRLSRTWRGVFAGLVCCFVIFLLYSIFEPNSNPWELTNWFAIFSCLLATVGLVHNSPHRKHWMWYSCFTGSLIAIF